MIDLPISIHEALELRSLQPFDLRRHYRLIDANRAHLSQYENWPRQTTLDMQKVFYRMLMQRCQQGTGFGAGIWACLDPDGPWEYVGLLSCDREGGGTYELGYWLGEHATRRGIMTHAVHAVLQAMFANPAVERVQLVIASENIASRRVAEKAGFALAEERTRDMRLHGRWIDRVIYEATRPTDPAC